MKSIMLILLLLLFSQRTNAQSIPLLKAVNYSSAAASEDPFNPDWDWENGDVIQDGVPRYWIYFFDKPNSGQEYAATLPWNQSGAWNGLEDRKKDDGWVLLTRDFGSPARRLSDRTNPYFVIYNTNRSLIRIFILLRNMSSTYTYSTIDMKWGNKQSGALAHLSPISYAMDKVNYMYNNATSAVISPLAMLDRWIYADFPLSLDTKLIPIENTRLPASLEFKVWGTMVNDIMLETKGFGAQGQKKFIDAFMKNNNFDSPGFSLNAGTMPSLNLDFAIPGVNVKATAPDWSGLINFFKNIAVDLSLSEIGLSNPFKGLMDGFNTNLLGLSGAAPINISTIDIKGLFNFFVGGGMKQSNIIQTAPTFFSSHYSSSGTMTSKVAYAVLTVPLPSARLNYKDPFNGGEIGLVRNNPVGILTLIKTPKILGRILVKKFYGIEYSFYEYEVAEDLQFQENPSSGLKLIKVEASLSTKFNNFNNDRYDWLTKKINSKNQAYLIEFDSPVDKNTISIRSMPVPVKYFKGRKLHFGREQTKLFVKIKAIFQRKDDPNAQPVVYYSTYATEDPVEYPMFYPGEYLYPPQPTIPPQNVQCSVGNTGGVVITWDANPEKNIKYYIVERSINGGSYGLLGTSSTTSFVDQEVKKAMIVYSAYRRNVLVNYRVKALSEWIDEDYNGILKSQLSEYSDAISINGSIYFGPEKRDATSIIPESNSLSQNFPNPFNPTTTIYYGVKEEGVVTITIFNALGQKITTLVNDKKEVGYHYAEWSAVGLPSGVYFYRISVGNFIETRKMTLLK